MCAGLGGLVVFLNVVSGNALGSYIANYSPPPPWTDNKARSSPAISLSSDPALTTRGWIVEPRFRCSTSSYTDHVVAKLIVQNVPETVRPWLFAQAHGNPKFYPSDEPVLFQDGSFEAKIYTGPGRNYDLYLFHYEMMRSFE
jgi:hypothetical protein